MLLNSTRYAISVCPECDGIVRKKLNIFDLSGKRGYKAICPNSGCKSLVWEIKEAKDKYRITVNCPACDEYHTYTMSKRSFWGKKYFSFNCTAWEVGVLYFGDDEQYIESQMDIQNDSISDMLSGIMEEDGSFEVMYDLIACINDIAQKGEIECICKNPDITVIIDENKVVLSCKNCGRKKIIIPTEENIYLLTQTGTIVLDDTIL